MSVVAAGGSGGGRGVCAKGAYKEPVCGRCCEAMEDARNSLMFATESGVMAERGICGVCVSVVVFSESVEGVVAT